MLWPGHTGPADGDGAHLKRTQVSRFTLDVSRFSLASETRRGNGKSQYRPPNPALQNLNLPVHDLHFGVVRFDPAHGPLENSVDVTGVVGDGDERHLGRLPDVVVSHFGSRQVELAAQVDQERLEDAALAFQRPVAGEMQFDATGTDDHNVVTQCVIT